jgi:transposase
MGSRVELYAAIRFDWQRNQMSIRALADKYGVHRRTVREAVESPIPPPRRNPPRSAPVLESVRELIDGMLAEDLAAPRKQRHTAKRIFERLRDEHHAQVSYSYVAKYVHRRRRHLGAEVASRAAARSGVMAGFVPQSHSPGAEAEVDFCDLWVRLAGQMTKCFLFTLRMSHSGKAIHRVFASQGQEAFLEGHVTAFEILGGVPFDKIRYDNLRSAVHRVLFGRNRTESGRWLAFRAHYGFEAFYCLPGREGAHEKGGVEGDGGRFRRAHLVPSRSSIRWPSSTPASLSRTAPRTAVASRGARRRWVRRSPSRRRCWWRCRRSGSTRRCLSPRVSTDTPRSWSGSAGTRCPRG